MPFTEYILKTEKTYFCHTHTGRVFTTAAFLYLLQGANISRNHYFCQYIHASFHYSKGNLASWCINN